MFACTFGDKRKNLVEKRALFPTLVGSSRLSRLAADDVSGEKRARSRFIFPSVFFRTTLMPCQLERREKMKKKKKEPGKIEREGGREREIFLGLEIQSPTPSVGNPFLVVALVVTKLDVVVTNNPGVNQPR